MNSILLKADVSQTLSTLSIVAFVIAGVALVLGIFLFIYFKIPGVISDLSGKNAKKSIARLRESNEKTGKKSYAPSETNAARGKVTSTIPGITSNGPDKRGAKVNAAQTPVQPAPAPRVQGQQMPVQSVPNVANEMPETGILDENRSENVGEATDLLYDPNATELLAETPKEPPKRVGGVPITQTETVMMIHTDEVIE
jgi:hypothetical protein